VHRAFWISILLSELTAAEAAATETTAAATSAAVTAAACTTGTTASAAATWAALTAGTTSAAHNCWLAWQKTFALHFLASEFASATNGFSLLADALFRRLFEVVAELHLAEDALALHLLLERFKSLIDVVVANENLHADVSSGSNELKR
jgi:hypothetical protein